MNDFRFVWVLVLVVVPVILLFPLVILAQELPPGFIIWMSNRDGDWDIYRMRLDGTQIQPLTQNDEPDINARISPDGRLIAWTRQSKGRRAVWLMNADGSQPRKLIDNAVMGEWTPDGKIVFFRGRNETQTYVYDLDIGKAKPIWPPQAKLQPRDVRGTRPSPDGRYFVGWSSRPRGTWLFSADGRFQKHVHSGCEGRFAPDGSFIYWVMEPGTFGKAGLDGQPGDPLYRTPKIEYGHTYFPRLSSDMNWLIFGACPNDQHDHDTSDYEIFLMKLDHLKPAWKKPLRLTFHPGTDRWPDIFIYHDETPPTSPENLKASVEGQQVRLTWDAASDPETGIRHYRIYRDGDPIAEVGDETRYTDRATDARKKYRYAVTAINGAGLESPPSKSVRAKTKEALPSPPEGLRALPGGRQVFLRWRANPEQDVREYWLYRAEAPEGPYRLRERLPTVRGTAYVDTIRLQEGQTYYYRLTAVDRKGLESARSEVARATLQPGMWRGLIALYTFTEGRGNQVHDVSRVEPALDLQILDPEGIRWLTSPPGIELTRSTLLRTPGTADKLLKRLKATNRMTLEVWIAPDNLEQTGPARIVSMSQDPGQRNFTLGQIGPEVAYRLRTTRTSVNGMPELDTTQRVLTTRPLHLVAVFDGKQSRVYVNGKRCRDIRPLEGDFRNWQPYPLLLGNEATRNRTWLGKIYWVAIYDRPLTEKEIRTNTETGRAWLGLAQNVRR